MHYTRSAQRTLVLSELPRREQRVMRQLLIVRYNYYIRAATHTTRLCQHPLHRHAAPRAPTHHAQARVPGRKLDVVDAAARVSQRRALVPPRHDAAAVVHALLLLPDEHRVVRRRRRQQLPKLGVRPRDARDGAVVRLPRRAAAPLAVAAALPDLDPRVRGARCEALPVVVIGDVAHDVPALRVHVLHGLLHSRMRDA